MAILRKKLILNMNNFIKIKKLKLKEDEKLLKIK